MTGANFPPTIQVISMSHNNLSSFDAPTNPLNDGLALPLASVDVSYNQLPTLGAFYASSSSFTLDASHNSINLDSLPPLVVNSSRVTSISFASQNPPITKIEQDTFSGANRLETL